MTREEFLLSKKPLVEHIARVVCRTYHLQSADAEDIVSEVMIKLLGVHKTKWNNDGYVKVTINNAVRTAIDKIMSRGSTLSTWRKYSTANISDLRTREDEDETSVLDRITSTEAIDDEATYLDTIADEHKNLAADLLAGKNISEIAKERNVKRHIVAHQAKRLAATLKLAK